MVLGVPELFFTFIWVYVRQKKNRSGKVSIQIIDKSFGKYKVLKTIGCSSNELEIENLVLKGKQWIKEKEGIPELDFSSDTAQIEQVFSMITEHKLVGLELVLGKIFDEIGFNAIEDEIFRQLVLFRLAFPKSKLKTTEYLSRYLGKHWSEDQLYLYLDKLHGQQKESVQKISFEHTQKILGGDIRVVFYDVTTLYFEIDKEDALRKTGFSKEGKHQNPQIVLGLLVSKNGYPLAYEIFSGNQFEGHTMLPVIDRFKELYKIEKLVIVADSGLLSKKNVELLIEKGYEFILGARIKAESKKVKEQILALELSNGQTSIIDKGDTRLVISYSDKRAKKDTYNRQKGLKRLEKSLKSGKLTKSNINNRGYNKYLKMEGDVRIGIDYDKYETDSKWDGLKGYLTNSDLTADELLANYQHLWQIEKAFRIAKSEIKIRPIYHRLQRRIEAHICISFVAYKVYKELERQLEQKQKALSASKVIEIAENIYQITAEVPNTRQKISKILLLTEEQRYLANLFGFG